MAKSSPAVTRGKRCQTNQPDLQGRRAGTSRPKILPQKLQHRRASTVATEQKIQYRGGDPPLLRRTILHPLAFCRTARASAAGMTRKTVSLPYVFNLEPARYHGGISTSFSDTPIERRSTPDWRWANSSACSKLIRSDRHWRRRLDLRHAGQPFDKPRRLLLDSQQEPDRPHQAVRRVSNRRSISKAQGRRGQWKGRTCTIKHVANTRMLYHSADMAGTKASTSLMRELPRQN